MVSKTLVIKEFLNKHKLALINVSFSKRVKNDKMDYITHFIDIRKAFPHNTYLSLHTSMGR